MKNKNISCPKCKGENVIRKGRQNTKFGFVQLFYCKDCQRKFAGRGLKNKTYGHGVIMNTINYYDIGNTLEESARHINRRFKVNVTKSSVHRWVMEFKNICTYYKFRAMVLKNYGKEIIFGKTFEHRGLAYNFKYHKGKLDILCNSNELSSLREYINRFESGCPIRFFEEDERCSQLMINIKNKRE
ncbi:MAG: hypothetical protein CVT88_06650 [Candidatus Altiarchaeales archaeon HGW-Altiarchaeales-1]|nr:MAG: hypothetical protein CVT88_06650 [Candidatus Altiarchaeales archaeon HGW-Altiarchaeales-1]